MAERTRTLPTRRLGRTEQQVTTLALGGVRYNKLPDAEAAAVVNRAIDLGINYIDTAHDYEESERKIGPVLADRREEVYLATKTARRDRDGARREIEESFQRLQTDHIDCIQLHSISREEEIAQVTGPDGALRAIEDYLEDGSIRFVGVTGHTGPAVLAKAMEEYPFDTLLVSIGAMNAAVRPFYQTVMPVARERDVGVLAMKVVGSGWLAEEGYTESALRFAIGRPGVTAAVVGVDSVDQLEENVRIAREDRRLSDDEIKKLQARMRMLYDEEPERAWFIHK